MKTRHWLLLFGGLLLLCLICALWFPHLRPTGCVAEIYQDGVLIRAVDLSALTEPLEIPLDAGHGQNILLAEPGQISMKSASCPDQLCVRQGTIKNGVYPIVCLPNRVVVKITGGRAAEADAVSK